MKKNYNANNKLNSNKTVARRSFIIETRIIGRAPDNNNKNKLATEVAIPLTI